MAKNRLWKIFILLLLSCQNSQEQSQADIARIMCECTAELHEFNIQLEEIQREGDTEGFTNAISNGQFLRKTALQCLSNEIETKALRQHYNALLKEEVLNHCTRNKLLLNDIYMSLKDLSLSDLQ